MYFPKVEVCLSPELYSLYSSDNQVVVVVDVVRASTSICVALSNNVNRIIPVESLELAFKYKQDGYLVSGERNSGKIEGFDFGNSPTEFLSPVLVGKDLVMTTTNGTKAINVAKNAFQLIIGSFINSDELLRYLLIEKKDVLILCSGWKSTVNIEDTLFSGFVAKKLIGSDKFITTSDSVHLAMSVYESGKNDIYDFIIKSSPRLKSKLSFIEDDLRYCLFGPKLKILPVYSNGEISQMSLK